MNCWVFVGYFSLKEVNETPKKVTSHVRQPFVEFMIESSWKGAGWGNFGSAICIYFQWKNWILVTGTGNHSKRWK